MDLINKINKRLFRNSCEQVLEPKRPQKQTKERNKCMQLQFSSTFDMISTLSPTLDFVRCC
jgi:hypothetical protein